MITRLTFLLVTLGFFGSPAYSQITAPNVTICGEMSVTLHVTSVGGYTGGDVNWYSVPFYGTSLGTGFDFETPVLMQNTTYYVDYVVNGVGICDRTAVTVTLSSSTVIASIFYESTTFCLSNETVQNVTRTGTAGGVYSVSPSGLSLNTVTGTFTPSTSNIGSYTVTYHVESSSIGCVEEDATATVIITSAPDQPSISYSASPHCTTAGLLNVTQTGATGGIYSASPSGLTIHPTSGQITPSTSLGGTYEVTYLVAGSGGCPPVHADATVTITALPTASISYSGTPFCQNISSASPTLSGTGAYTGGAYSYTGTESGLASFNTTTGIFDPSTSTAGTYTIKYTTPASAGCAAVEASTLVTINPLPSASILGTASVCQDIAPPNISFTGDYGTAPYTFTYKINSGIDRFVTSASGTNPVTATVANSTVSPGTFVYTLLSVTDANGCTHSASGDATITVTPAQVATFSYLGSPFCKTGTVSPTYTGGGVAGAFTKTSGDGVLSFDTETGAINLAASDAGSYTITNTLSACGNAVATCDIIINALPTATITGTLTACVTTTITAVTDATNKSYVWYKGVEIINGETGSDLIVTESGNYKVKITNTDTNCEFTSEVSTVTINPLPIVSITGNTMACTSTTLTGVTDATNKTYQWYKDGFEVESANASTLLVTEAGSYTVKVTNTDTDCEFTSAAAVVTIYTVPAAAISTALAEVCEGASPVITFEGSLGVAPYTFTYTINSGSDLLVTTSSGSIVTVAVPTTEAGNFVYTLKSVRDASFAGCQHNYTETTATVNVVADPTISDQPDENTIECLGGTVELSVTAANGTPLLTYQWYSNDENNNTGGQEIEGASADTFTPPTTLEGTIYYYVVVGANGEGCGTATSSVAVVTVVANPTISGQPAASTSECVGGSVQLSVTAANGTGAYSYQWYSNTTASIGGTLLTGATSATYTPATTSAGTMYYYVIVGAAGNGCGTVTSDFAEIIVVADPSWTAYSFPTTTVCEGESVTFSVGINDGLSGTVTWIRSATSAGSGTTVTSPDIPVAGTWYYRPQYTTNGAGCNLADGTETTVTVNPLPLANTISGTATQCAGAAGVPYSVTNDHTGTATYAWTYVGGTGASLSAATGNAITINFANDATSGTLTVIETITATGCSTTNTLPLTINPRPVPALAGPLSACIGSTGNVYTTDASMTEYAWTVSAGGTITSGGTVSDRTVTVTWTTTGAKSVSVNYSNGNGCTAATATVANVTVNPLPVPTISGPLDANKLPAVLNGTTIEQVYTTESGMSNYIWAVSGQGAITAPSDPTISNSITVTWTAPTSQQFVSVTYTSVAGCAAAAPTVLIINYYPFEAALDPALIPKFVDPLPHFAAGLRVNAKAGGNLTIKQVLVQQIALPTGTVLSNGTIGSSTPTVGLGNYAAYQISNNGGPFGPAMWPAQTIEAQVGNQLTVQYQNDLVGVKFSDFNILADQTLLQNGYTLTGDPLTNPYTGDIPMVVHLHGGEMPSNSDGGPTAWFMPTGNSLVGPGFAHAASSLATYPNQQEEGTLWYHPHDQGLTRINVYTGLAGYYFLRGPNEEAAHLPGWSGDDKVQEVTPTGKVATFNGVATYLPEIEVAIQDRMFNDKGELYWPVAPTNPEIHPFWTPEFFGDVMTVNGKAWPYLSVAPRKYRFRMLDGCNARFLNVWLRDTVNQVNGPAIKVIGSDGALLDAPVILDPSSAQTLLMSPGERYDVVIDFTGQEGKVFTLMNDAAAPYPTGSGVVAGTTDRIMQFVVNGLMKTPAGADGGTDNSLLPGNLRPVSPMVKLTDFAGNLTSGVTPAVKRQIILNEVTGAGGPVQVLFNNSKFDADSPIAGAPLSFGGPTEIAAEGTTEQFSIINTTIDAHPIHIHLTQWQLVSRQAFDRVHYLTDYAAAWAPRMTGSLFEWPAGQGYPGGSGSPYPYSTVNDDGAVGGNPAITPYLQGSPIPANAEERVWKDDIKAFPGEVATYIVRYAPTNLPIDAPATALKYPFDPSAGPGYVWHCHIIDHEDMDMMRPLMVTKSATTQVPQITAQPATSEVCDGGVATYSVTATSARTISYQWQISVNEGVDWNNLTNGAPYSGVLTNTLSINPAALALTTYQYRVKLTNMDGNVTSDAALLTVVADPSIGTEPASPAAICVGGTSADITIAASNGTPSLTYQWQYNNGGTWENVVGATPAGATYTGATATTFSVAGISVAGAYEYKCIVSASGNGCGDATSNTVTVTVEADPTWNVITTPATSITYGSSVTFSATVNQVLGGTITWIRSDNVTPGAGTETTVTTGDIPPSVGTWYYRPHFAPTGSGCNLADGTQTAVVVNTRAVALTGTRAYNGTTDADYTILTISNNVDAGNLTLSGVGTLAGKAVGSQAISAGTLALGGSAAGNYTLTGLSGSVSVTARAITLTAAANTKAYNGDNTAAASPTITSGTLASGDVGTYIETYNNATQGSGKTLTPAVVSIVDGSEGNMAGNYNVTLTTSTNGVINTRAVALTGTRAYDGTTDADYTILTISNNVDGVNLTLSGVGTLAGKAVGSHAISAGTLALGGSAAGNYTLTGLSGSVSVTARAITLTAAANTKAYNGDNTAAASPTITSGTLASGDVGTYIETYNNATQGLGKTLTPAVVSIVDGSEGNMAGNYNVTLTTSTNGVINTRAVALTGTRAYDGITDADYTILTISNNVDAGNLTLSGVGTLAGKAVGSHAISAGTLALGGSAAGNYTLTGLSGSVSVTARAITLTAAANTKTYNGDNTAAASPTITSGTLASGDVGTYVETYDNATPGTGKTMTPAVVSIVDGSAGNMAGNYNVTLTTSTNGVINPTAPTGPASQSFCSGVTVAQLKLAVTGTTGTLTVYDAATNGNIISDGTALTATNYYVSQILNSAESARLTVAVTVTPLPNFAGHEPGSASVCAGVGHTFTSAPTNATSYQWEINTGTTGSPVWVDLTNSAPYSGVTTTSLVISNVTGLNAKEYRLEAQNTGSCPATPVASSVATLTVTPCLATVTTTAITTGTTTTAYTSGGNVTSIGGSAVTARGICWSTSTNPTTSDAHTINGTGTGSYTSTLTGLIAGTTYYVRAYATNSGGTAYGSDVSFTTLSTSFIGESLNGGIVFYTNGTTGLIAATSDVSAGAPWGCGGTDITGTSLTIGTGQANTTLIITACVTQGIAADLCDDLGTGVWYLPSRDELAQMYTHKSVLGISTGTYWSSSQIAVGTADAQDFGGSMSAQNKTDNNKVRAIRSF